LRSLTQPAVEARRVARNAQKPVHAIVDAGTELTLTRVCEMVFETGPSCVLQVHSLLTEGIQVSLVLSLAVSCVTAGFMAAVISFDVSSDPNPLNPKPRPRPQA
jgi:hypothetical protein